MPGRHPPALWHRRHRRQGGGHDRPRRPSQRHEGRARRWPAIRSDAISSHPSDLVAIGPCIDQRPIEGHTNEAGAIIDTVYELLAVYGHTKLVEAFIFDAGNNHLACASYIDGRGIGYIGRLKDDQPTLMSYAQRHLGGLGEHQTQQTQVEETPRTKVVRRMWRLCLSAGVHTWEHARQLVRIERTCFRRKDRHSPWVETSRGERYWISNIGHKRLDEHSWMSVCRYYWRIENEGNWSADAQWWEDAKRTPWASWPDGIEVVCLLRMLGMSIVGVLRAMRHKRRGGGRAPSWSRCTKEVMLALALGRGEDQARN
jgi:hypothetical protein